MWRSDLSASDEKLNAMKKNPDSLVFMGSVPRNYSVCDNIHSVLQTQHKTLQVELDATA